MYAVFLHGYIKSTFVVSHIGVIGIFNFRSLLSGGFFVSTLTK